MRKSVPVLGLMLAICLSALPARAAPFSARSPSVSRAAGVVTGDDIVATALRYLGYPYTTVGNSPATGFSCIGFVSYVYRANGIPMPDDLWSAMAFAPSVAFSDLQPGDVLFFQNTVWPGVSHTAIYLGGGRFVHAEWYNRGVVTSSFSNDPIDFNYWTEHYLTAIRPWGRLPTPPPAPAQPAVAQNSTPILRDGPRAAVTVSGLNVRLRPSLFGSIQQVADQGTRVVVLKRYRHWDWVQLPDRSFGWVLRDGLNGGSLQSVVDLTERTLPSTTISIDALRVHARPGIAAPVLTTAYRSERLQILRRWNSWMRVITPDGTRGWIKTGYVSAQTARFRRILPDAPMHVATRVAHVSIHVRADASLASGVLTALYPGERYQVLGRSGGWLEVQTPDGTDGYVVASLLGNSTMGSGPGIPSSSSQPRLTAGVRVHLRPGRHAPVVGLAAAGVHVHILGRRGAWIHVRFAGGRTGYVFQAYVQR